MKQRNAAYLADILRKEHPMAPPVAMQKPIARRPDDPRVVDFLEKVRMLEDSNETLSNECRQLGADLSAANHIIETQDRQIRDITVDRDREMRVSVALEAHIKAIAAGCLQALRASGEAKRVPDTELTNEIAVLIENMQGTPGDGTGEAAGAEADGAVHR